MRKGAIIVGANSPLAAYLDSDCVEHVEVEHTVEKPVKPARNSAPTMSELVARLVRCYASALAMYALHPMHHWACGQAAVRLEWRAAAGQPLLLAICAAVAALVGDVRWCRVLLLSHVNLALLLWLAGKLCAHVLRQLDRSTSHSVGILHKYQSVLMGFPVSAPMVSAKVLEARRAPLPAIHPDMATVKHATCSLLLQLRAACDSALADPDDDADHLLDQPSPLLQAPMKVSELQALQQDVFHVLLPGAITALCTGFHDARQPMITSVARLMRFVGSLLVAAGQLSNVASTSCRARYPKPPARSESSRSDRSSADAADDAVDKMFAAVSSTRRHAAAARAVYETSVLELWKLEHELVHNRAMLSIQKGGPPDGNQLSELRRAAEQIERAASDAIDLDHILGELQCSAHSCAGRLVRCFVADC